MNSAYGFVISALGEYDKGCGHASCHTAYAFKNIKKSLEDEQERSCSHVTALAYPGFTYRLSYNGSMFAKEGLGILLTFEHLIDCSKESGLVFRPLSPKQTSELYLIWNKYPS